MYFYLKSLLYKRANLQNRIIQLKNNINILHGKFELKNSTYQKSNNILTYISRGVLSNFVVLNQDKEIMSKLYTITDSMLKTFTLVEEKLSEIEVLNEKQNKLITLLSSKILHIPNLEPTSNVNVPTRPSANYVKLISFKYHHHIIKTTLQFIRNVHNKLTAKSNKLFQQVINIKVYIKLTCKLTTIYGKLCLLCNVKERLNQLIKITIHLCGTTKNSKRLVEINKERLQTKMIVIKKIDYELQDPIQIQKNLDSKLQFVINRKLVSYNINRIYENGIDKLFIKRFEKEIEKLENGFKKKEKKINSWFESVIQEKVGIINKLQRK